MNDGRGRILTNGFEQRPPERFSHFYHQGARRSWFLTIVASWFVRILFSFATQRDRTEVFAKPLLLASFLFSVLWMPSQAQGIGTPAVRYYLDITRPDCCRLSDRDWQRIAATLKEKGIPTFFGLYDVLTYREPWRPVRLRRSPPDEGWLILGPFDSAASATNALNRLPRLLPNRMGGEDERRNGVEPGSTGDRQTWRIGMYQLSGFRTSLPIQVQKPQIIHQAGTVEGVIVEKNEGASGYGITVESRKVIYYVYLAGNMGGVKTQIGDVDTVGNHVRVTYKSKRKVNDSTYSLDAIRIVQIKK
jgi:hypothetical protein